MDTDLVIEIIARIFGSIPSSIDKNQVEKNEKSCQIKNPYDNTKIGRFIKIRPCEETYQVSLQFQYQYLSFGVDEIIAIY